MNNRNYIIIDTDDDDHDKNKDTKMMTSDGCTLMNHMKQIKPRDHHLFL